MSKRVLVKEDYEVMTKIANRIRHEGLTYSDHITMMMDLEAATEICNIDLNRLLKFDRFNFVHDILGIKNCLNRITRDMENCFLPRSAR